MDKLPYELQESIILYTDIGVAIAINRYDLCALMYNPHIDTIQKWSNSLLVTDWLENNEKRKEFIAFSKSGDRFGVSSQTQWLLYNGFVNALNTWPLIQNDDVMFCLKSRISLEWALKAREKTIGMTFDRFLKDTIVYKQSNFGKVEEIDVMSKELRCLTGLYDYRKIGNDCMNVTKIGSENKHDPIYFFINKKHGMYFDLEYLFHLAIKTGCSDAVLILKEFLPEVTLSQIDWLCSFQPKNWPLFEILRKDHKPIVDLELIGYAIRSPNFQGFFNYLKTINRDNLVGGLLVGCFLVNGLMLFEASLDGFKWLVKNVPQCMNRSEFAQNCKYVQENRLLLAVNVQKEYANANENSLGLVHIRLIREFLTKEDYSLPLTADDFKRMKEFIEPKLEPRDIILINDEAELACVCAKHVFKQNDLHWMLKTTTPVALKYIIERVDGMNEFIPTDSELAESLLDPLMKRSFKDKYLKDKSFGRIIQILFDNGVLDSVNFSNELMRHYWGAGNEFYRLEFIYPLQKYLLNETHFEFKILIFDLGGLIEYLNVELLDRFFRGGLVMDEIDGDGNQR